MKFIKQFLKHLFAMFKISLVILLIALPEAVICNGMPIGQAILLILFSVVLLTVKKENAPAGREPDASADR